jgi:hypothetical protein
VALRRSGRRHVLIRTLTLVAACAACAATAPSAMAAGNPLEASPGPVSASLTQLIQEPLHYGSQLFSCPDPDVFKLPGQDRWVASCTSDYGQQNPIYGSLGYRPSAAAFPIYETTGRSFRHWQFKQFIFPPGHFPWEAIPPQGNWPGGRYWADEIHRIGKNWVAYFGAEINPTMFHRVYPGKSQGGDFGIFVAWSRSLFGGNWHSRLLHYRGQFNTVPGNSKEISGGVIDPSVARNPQTGQLNIVWAKQANEIFEGELSPNGLSMRKTVHLALVANKPWMCHPNATGRHCVLEGPVLAPDPAHKGVMDLFANADGTWNDTYKTAVAISIDPEHVKWDLVKYPIEVGNQGFGLQGPGIGAQPFQSPNGSWLMAVHLMTQRTHDSQHRYLGFVHVTYNNETHPLMVPQWMASDDEGLSAERAGTVPVPVPTVNGLGTTGKPRRVVAYIR